MWTVNFLTKFKIKYVLLQAHISPDHAALKPRQIEKGLTFNQLPHNGGNDSHKRQF